MFSFRHWLGMKEVSIIMCLNLLDSCHGSQCMLCFLNGHRMLTVLSLLSSMKDSNGLVCFIKLPDIVVFEKWLTSEFSASIFTVVFPPLLLTNGNCLYFITKCMYSISICTCVFYMLFLVYFPSLNKKVSSQDHHGILT
jgi:hypothetical protein